MYFNSIFKPPVLNLLRKSEPGKLIPLIEAPRAKLRGDSSTESRLAIFLAVATSRRVAGGKERCRKTRGTEGIVKAVLGDSFDPSIHGPSRVAIESASRPLARLTPERSRHRVAPDESRVTARTRGPRPPTG